MGLREEFRGGESQSRGFRREDLVGSSPERKVDDGEKQKGTETAEFGEHGGSPHDDGNCTVSSQLVDENDDQKCMLTIPRPVRHRRHSVRISTDAERVDLSGVKPRKLKPCAAKNAPSISLYKIKITISSYPKKMRKRKRPNTAP